MLFIANLGKATCSYLDTVTFCLIGYFTAYYSLFLIILEYFTFFAKFYILRKASYKINIDL